LLSPRACSEDVRLETREGEAESDEKGPQRPRGSEGTPRVMDLVVGFDSIISDWSSSGVWRPKIETSPVTRCF
jgi:hypothetical protein